MTPFYLSQISPTPLKEGDQDQRQLLPFTLPIETSTFPFPILFDNPQDRVTDRFHHPQQQILFEPKPIDLLLIDEPSDPVSFPTINNNNNNTIERSPSSPYVGHQDPQGSGKWMSSKMRIMRKMLNSDQATMNKPREHIQVLEEHQQLSQDTSNSNSSSTNSPLGGFIRVCSDCNTTKTPLWRSGPRGPKSLCNACGIRQRKARRAMALGSGLVPTKTPSKLLKEKRSEVQHTVPFKKRCKITASGTAQKKLQFEDVTINLSKNPAFHRVFPQDERDAAILLMALSCDLIRS